MAGWNDVKEKEWFRLSGGRYFGYNRLGYFFRNILHGRFSSTIR